MENDIERLRRSIYEYAARELAAKERKAGAKGPEEGAPGGVRQGMAGGVRQGTPSDAREGMAGCAAEAEATVKTTATAGGGRSAMSGDAVAGMGTQIGRILADAGITVDNPDRLKELVNQMGFDPQMLNDPQALKAMAEQMTSHMSPEIKASLAEMAKAVIADLGASGIPPEIQSFLDSWGTKKR
ncbi:MAG TPA: hypothetical protein GX507_07550 [Clostridia bacterium]|nr:hypothetical protein [Clostridia bacterium]